MDFTLGAYEGLLGTSAGLGGGLSLLGLVAFSQTLNLYLSMSLSKRVCVEQFVRPHLLLNSKTGS